MLDVENYRNEPPDRGKAPVFGAAFSGYLRQHMERVRALAPGIHIIAYSNASFWDGAVSGTNQKWVGDPALAAEIDWIVPRYPVWPPSRFFVALCRRQRRKAMEGRATEWVGRMGLRPAAGRPEGAEWRGVGRLAVQC